MNRRKRETDARERPPGVDELLDRIFLSDYRSLELFAYSKLRDRGLAEIAVQEAFTLALERPEAFLNSEDPVKWLYEAVRYISLHSFRERQYLLTHMASLDEIPESSLSREDSYSPIPRELLNSPEMKLLWEFYVAGYSARELAEKYEIETGACKMRLLRARRKLAEKLKTYA